MNTSFSAQFKTVQKESKSARAFRRVRSAMYYARERMKDGKELPRFLDHLRKSFQEVGQGHLYNPEPVVTWADRSDSTL